MAQTVSECLTAATDSVTVINDINSKGLSSTHISAADRDWETFAYCLCHFFIPRLTLKF